MRFFMSIKIALATPGDSRDDFYAKRAETITARSAELGWLRDHCDLIESPVVRSGEDAAAFAVQARAFGAEALIVHLPVWADPILTIKLHNHLPLPILLLGNLDPSTGSLVGLLAAGGALDQIGCRHTRVLDHATPEERRPILAFIAAAGARAALKGQTLGLFGGRSLGIVTATADPAQWQRLFGVDIQHLDQSEIVALAESLSVQSVNRHVSWFTSQVGGVTYGGKFSADRLEHQVRSYLATRELVARYGFDFVGVKCQPEMTDGYVSQCVAHMMVNGTVDADGEKAAFVHACESDADGALTMQVLHLVSGGKPAALLDIRWLNPATGVWTLVNCGAMPAAFFATPADPTGLAAVQVVPHIFGTGGGGALPAVVAPQQVTLARLCRRDGAYWMAIVSGSTEKAARKDLARATPAYPQAFVHASAGRDIIMEFGSNHIHMVAGNYADELVHFCDQVGIPHKRWR
jgi:L-fucose isomerase